MYNIKPIFIGKEPKRQEHLPMDHNDFECVINGVDLDDIMDYILLMIDSPKTSYWQVNDFNARIYRGELMCAICFYLQSSGLLIIEDMYYKEGFNNGRTKYVKVGTYFNKIETHLYKPILDRLSVWHLDLIEKYYHKIGKGYLRKKKLDQLLVSP